MPVSRPLPRTTSPCTTTLPTRRPQPTCTTRLRTRPPQPTITTTTIITSRRRRRPTTGCTSRTSCTTCRRTPCPACSASSRPSTGTKVNGKRPEARTQPKVSPPASRDDNCHNMICHKEEKKKTRPTLWCTL
uniref:(northern house mosquito) hypothetical protein n=1 Tax=Culex pipiens TaxID=7175 RepID=A0A8D8NLW9_CULPI